MKTGPWCMAMYINQGKLMRQARGMPQYHFRAIMFFYVKLMVIIIHRATMSAGNPTPMGDECRESKSDGTLCQKSKAACHVRRNVFFAKKGYKSACQCENKSRISNGTSGKNNNFQRSGTYESTCKSRFFSNQFSCKKIQVRSGTGTDYGRGKSGGKSRNAENRKGNRVKPVKKRRLIIPVFPVNTGGKPVACEKHFFCRFTVDRFVRIYERNDVRK